MLINITQVWMIRKIISFSKCKNKGQKTVNEEYIKGGNIDFDDKIKELA